MFEEGFFKRLWSSVDRVLFGLDLVVAFVLTGLIYVLTPNFLIASNARGFIRNSVSLTTTLIIVTVTSVSILVSLSNSSAIIQLKKEQLYKKFLFTFEFTALLALITSVIGVFAQSLNMNRAKVHIFLFFFIYTVLAAATVISRLITYGDKVALLSLAESLPEDLDERTSEFQEEEEKEEEIDK